MNARILFALPMLVVAIGCSSTQAAGGAGSSGSGSSSGGSSGGSDACAGSPLFCDDYSDPALGAAYTETNGTWTRSAGSLSVTDETAWQRARATLAGDYTDFDVTLAGRSLGQAGLGLVYGAQSLGDGLAVIVHPVAPTADDTAGIYVKQLVPGDLDEDLAVYTIPTAFAGTPFTLRVRRVQTTLTIWFNGEQVLEVNDTARTAHGQLGLLESTTDQTAGAGARFTLLRLDSATPFAPGTTSGSGAGGGSGSTGGSTGSGSTSGTGTGTGTDTGSTGSSGGNSGCAGSYVFCDDYSDATLASAYVTSNGAWTRNVGSYVAMDSVAWQRARALLSGSDYTDFDVTLDGSSLGDSGFGLAYAVPSSTTASSYAVIIHPAQFQGVYLKKITTGQTDTDLASYALPAQIPGQRVVLRVARAGTTVTVWLNGVQVIQQSDGATFAHGKLGLIESTTNQTSGAGATFTRLRLDSATTWSGGGSSGGSGGSGSVTPTGGSVDLLHFAITGDTRPSASSCPSPCSSENAYATQHYPAAIINQIADRAKARGAQFVIDAGDHMDTWMSATYANQQMALYQAAMARFGQPGAAPAWFLTYGNHECDVPAHTTQNCVPAAAGGTSSTNSNSVNTAAYLAAMQAEGINDGSVPWYSFDVSTSLGIARFVVIADNAWCTAQQTWLTSTLTAADTEATYTIIVRHHPPDDGGANSAIKTLIRAHKFSLWVTGHEHQYRHPTSDSGRAVVIGTGGAPLGGSINDQNYFFGYAMVDQLSSGELQLTMYDSQSDAPVDQWSVGPNL